MTTYRIGNHVYYWVWLRPDRLMRRIQLLQQQHSYAYEMTRTEALRLAETVSLWATFAQYTKGQKARSFLQQLDYAATKTRRAATQNSRALQSEDSSYILQPGGSHQQQGISTIFTTSDYRGNVSFFWGKACTFQAVILVYYLLALHSKALRNASI